MLRAKPVGARAAEVRKVSSVAVRAWNTWRTGGLRGVLDVAGRRVRAPFIVARDILVVLYASPFFRSQTGSRYHVGFVEKLGLLRRFILNARRIRGGSHWKEHLLIATAILDAPPETEGVVVECGAFQGMSASNLSLVCRRTGRRLVICDSFEGLPKPAGEEALTLIPHRQEHYRFREGQYRGELETVRGNVARYGAIEVCDFVKGYFDDTLPGLERKIVVVFEDADLLSSVRSCLTHLWGRMQDGATFFCHEPWSRQIVELFYDRTFWQERFGSEPPGFYGSGTGAPLGIHAGSGIGYARKIDPATYLERSRLRPGMW
jgi:O-methyltransferase